MAGRAMGRLAANRELWTSSKSTYMLSGRRGVHVSARCRLLWRDVFLTCDFLPLCEASTDQRTAHGGSYKDPINRARASGSTPLGASIRVCEVEGTAGTSEASVRWCRRESGAWRVAALTSSNVEADMWLLMSSVPSV